jgi:predicted nucleic acid-binding protein
MILDTNALSAAADDDPGVIAQLARADEMAIPVIVLGEYRHGIAQSRNRATYENWLAGLLQDCTIVIRPARHQRAHHPLLRRNHSRIKAQR